MCSLIAAATAYANHSVNMVPFYIYYSMFGFQRVGDFIWAAGDRQARGFLIGGTAGRTTLAGEGLQHQDGHSQLLATHGPELRGVRPDLRLRTRGHHPGRPAPHVRRAGRRFLLHHLHERELRAAGDAGGRRAGHPQGHVPAADGGQRQGAREPAGLRHDPARSDRLRQMLEKEYGVPADVFSVPSFSELRREALDVERWNLLHPGEAAAACPTCSNASASARGPFIAATDYMRIVPDQIRQWVPGRYIVLGTDGYGRSDSRAQLRGIFEVDRRYIVVAALRALADEGKLDVATVKSAIEEIRHRSGQAESGDGLSRGAAVTKQLVEITVPDIGDYSDVEVIDVLVKPGDTMALDRPLITLETEKATMDVPSTVAGVVREMKLQVGRASRRAT